MNTHVRARGHDGISPHRNHGDRVEARDQRRAVRGGVELREDLRAAGTDGDGATYPAFSGIGVGPKSTRRVESDARGNGRERSGLFDDAGLPPVDDLVDVADREAPGPRAVQVARSFGGVRARRLRGMGLSGMGLGGEGL